MLTFTYAYTFIFLNDLLTLTWRFWFILGETFHSGDANKSEEPMFSKQLHSPLQLQKRLELDRWHGIVHSRSQQAENLWKPGLLRGRISSNHASCCVHGESSWTKLRAKFAHAVLYLPCGWLCPQILSFCSNKIVPNLEIQKLDSYFLVYTYILHNYLHILVLTVTWGFWFNFNTM